MSYFMQTSVAFSDIADHFSFLVRGEGGTVEWMHCNQQRPLTKLSQRQQVKLTKHLDERLSNYFSVLMALYLWFLCLCLLTVIASPLLFIFNESLKKGALTTAGFILILFTVERTGNQTGLHLLKVIANTEYLRMEENGKKKNKVGSVCTEF